MMLLSMPSQEANLRHFKDNASVACVQDMTSIPKELMECISLVDSLLDVFPVLPLCL